MRIFYTVFVIALFFLVETVVANNSIMQRYHGQKPLLEIKEDGLKIDWTNGLVIANAQATLPMIRSDGKRVRGKKVATSLSMARAMAMNVAIEKAKGRLMLGVLSLKFDSNTTLRQKMELKPGLQEQIGRVEEFFKIRSRKTGSGLVSVEIALSFFGTKGLYSLIVNKYYNTEMAPETDGESFSDKITSIIVDIREFPDFNPSMEPRIYSSQGRLLYGPEIVSQTCSIKYGLVSWKISDIAAREGKRTGTHPYYIYAGGVIGKNKSDIFFHEKDVSRLLANKGGRKALRRCLITFVVSK